MVREQGGALRGHLSRLRLQQGPDALVQLAALLQQQPLVGDLLREALAEAVLVAREEALPVEEASLLERGHLAVDVDALALEQRRELVPAELSAEHGRYLH